MGDIFTVEGKEIRVYRSGNAGGPVVYLNSFGDEGERVYGELQKMGLEGYALVTVSGLDWDRDMTPWEAPAVFRGGSAFAGGAKEYLKLLLNSVVPLAEASIPGPVTWRGVAGYSLAGLFALYSIANTGVFSRAASMSGSLWFPGFEEYALSREPKCQRIYLSLGDREHLTRNPHMSTVLDRTKSLSAFYAGRGIETTFRLEPGGHFKDPALRTASGIAWLLT